MSRNTIGYIALVVLLVVAAFFSLNLFLRQRSEHDMLEVRQFPHTLGDWKGEDLEIPEEEYDILETRNLISRRYTNGNGESIHLLIIYSETNRSVFHPPEVCLIGCGIEIRDIRREGIVLGNKSFFVNRLYLESNNARDICLYCYKAGDLYTDNFYLQQGVFALNQLLGRRKGGATIRVSMPTRESEEITLATLKDFMKEAIKTLERL